MSKQYLHFPRREGQRIVVAALGRTEDIAAYAAEPAPAQSLNVMGGRLNVVDGDLTNPSVGTVVDRSDGKTSFVLFNQITATSATALLNGQPVDIQIEKQLQDHGFQDGLHYWLPIDGNDDFVCEPGRRHRKWYVSKSATAKTRAQIATDAGVAETTVTGAWLDARPEYGATEATAVHYDVFALWSLYVYGAGKPGRSDHIYLERGYSYLGWSITKSNEHAFSGEDELHPMLITSYGAGTAPVVKGLYTSVPAPFAVYRRVNFDDAWPRYGFSIAIERSSVPRTIQGSDTAMLTIRETRMLTPWHDAPLATVTVTTGPYTGDVIWKTNGNHVNACYSSMSEGLLLDSNLPHHAGYKNGYDYRARAEFPMPMTMFSHGYYLQGDCLGTFARNNFVASNSSCGFQTRSGVVVEGNVVFDNNIATGVNSFNGARQYNIVLDNVIESMGYRRVAHDEGGFNWGLGANGPGTVLAGNVVMHGANPDDPDEVLNKPGGNVPVSISAKLSDDTQVWKWAEYTQEVSGLDPAILDQTTIYRWVGMKLAKPVETPAATKAEVIAYFRDAPSVGAAVREYREWVKSRFGRPSPSTANPADLVFRPQTIMDGRRWDNRRNWSGQRLPGGNVADTADLDGHYARFGTVNADIAGLWSRGGSLDVSSGRLDIGSLMDAAKITTRYSGQVWIDGPSQPLRLELFGGRAVLGGPAANLDIVAGGSSQVLFGSNATIPAGKSLILRGMRTRTGWDGTGTATLTVAGSLEFRAGAEITLASSFAVRRVYQWVGKTVVGSLSGATGRVAAVQRWDGNSLKVWLDDLTGTPVANDQFEVMRQFDANFLPIPTLVTVATVDAAAIPMLQRFRSGAIGDGLTEPTVAASLVLAAGSQVVITRQDLLAPGSYDLTGPGVTVTDQGATLPAGVTVTGGKLVLVV